MIIDHHFDSARDQVDVQLVIVKDGSMAMAVSDHVYNWTLPSSPFTDLDIWKLRMIPAWHGDNHGTPSFSSSTHDDLDLNGNTSPWHVDAPGHWSAIYAEHFGPNLEPSPLGYKAVPIGPPPALLPEPPLLETVLPDAFFKLRPPGELT